MNNAVKLIYIKLFILFFILVFLITLGLKISVNFSDNYLKNMKSMKQIIFTNKLNFNDLEDLRSYFKNSDSISGYCQEISSVKNIFNAGTTKIVKFITDNDYETFFDKKIITGSFLSKEACDLGKKVAVVSLGLAKKLYKSKNIIGNEIYIDNIKYKIIGIFEEKQSLINYFADDGLERVYVPYSSVNNESKIDILNVDGNLKENMELEIKDIKELLNKRFDRVDSDFEIVDYTNASVKVSQISLIFIEVLNLCLILSLIIILIKYINSIIKNIKISIHKHYLFQYIRLKFKRVTLDLVVICAICIIVYVLIRYNKINFNIYRENLPPNNIFDLKYYVGIVKKKNQLDYQQVVNINTVFRRYYLSSIKLNNIICVSSFFIFFDFLYTVKLLTLCYNGNCKFNLNIISILEGAKK